MNKGQIGSWRREWVYHKLQLYRKTLLAKKGSLELSAKFHGFYYVEEKVA